jgi:hypothetical protein
MVTRNAASAAGNGERLGSIEVGKVADLAIFAANAGVSYRAVIEATNASVLLVLVGGTPVFGERASVQALDPECEALDVCGEERALCAVREFGIGFAELSDAVAGAYPAFFCGTPPGEPTCIPSRPGEFTGIPTAGDGDGDGVLDAADDCPTIFNPLRPLDEGIPADADGDGIGDACDESPLP